MLSKEIGLWLLRIGYLIACIIVFSGQTKADYRFGLDLPNERA